MKIGFFHGDLPKPGRKPGGVTVGVHRLAQALVDHGHDVSVWSFDAPPADARYGHWHIGRRVKRAGKLRRMWISPVQLNRVAFDDVDVLHLHGDDWFFVCRHVPTVRTLYGSAWYEARSATSRKRRMSQYVHAGFELASAHLATETYGLGPGVPCAYRTVGNLDLGVKIPARVRASAERPPVIAFIGTWKGRKRGEMLWDTFVRNVRVAVPEAELVMVADYAATADGVTLWRAPTDQQVKDLLDRAAAFCLPSQYEGFGIPYLEAMAAGSAIVATDNLGARHVLGDTLQSQLVTPECLGEALIDLLTNPTRRTDVAARGRARARAFSWHRVVADHERAYRSAINLWDSTRFRLNLCR